MKILRAKRHLCVVHHEFDIISSNNDYGKYLEHFKYKHDIRLMILIKTGYAKDSHAL